MSDDDEDPFAAMEAMLAGGGEDDEPDAGARLTVSHLTEPFC